MTLLERDEQLRAAAAYLADAASGHGRLAADVDEAGVGKTTFLEGVLSAPRRGPRSAGATGRRPRRPSTR